MIAREAELATGAEEREPPASAPAELPLPAAVAPKKRSRPAFFTRVHRASLAIFLVCLLLSLQWGSWKVAFGVVTGWALATALLVFWQAIVRVAFGQEQPRPFLVGVSLLVKLPVVGAFVWFLISRHLVSPAAFALGFALPQVAVAVLAVGGGLAVGAGLDSAGGGRKRSLSSAANLRT